MSQNKQKVGRWLHPLVFVDGAQRVELRHVGVSDRTTVIRAWDLAGADEERVKAVGEQLDQAAQDDADGVGRVQKYAVAAIKDAAPVGRLVLRYAAEKTDEDGEGGYEESEPANGRGLAAQAMRHAEAFAKTLAVGAGSTIESLTRQNARLSGMVETMLEKHMEHLVLVEELTSKKHERELQLKQEETKAQVTEELAKTVSALIPGVVKKLTGVTPAGYLPPEAVELRKLAAALSEQELDGLQTVLKPEHAAVVMSILKGVTESEAAEQEAKRNGVVQ